MAHRQCRVCVRAVAIARKAVVEQAAAAPFSDLVAARAKQATHVDPGMPINLKNWAPFRVTVPSGVVPMNAEQVLAFRLARSGLAAEPPSGLVEAAACPVSDFARGAALTALGARVHDLSGGGLPGGG